MKKVILIPDSFKGTMSSSRICEIMAESIHSFFPETQIVSVPVADGGEGSVDAFLSAMGGERVEVVVKGPYFEDMTGFYGIVNGDTAIIEMAACAGLPLVGENRHAEQTTTYGVGQLMLHAVRRGCTKLVIGLGGSATNDAGTGAAAAVGVKFLDRDGKEFIPTGGTLENICDIDISGIDPQIQAATITAMCDIDNPLYGENGAAYIFGPQKGADPEMVKVLDRNLRAFSETVKKALGMDLSGLEGGGAAGGMGAGMSCFFGAKLQMGIETVLETVGFDHLLEDADVVFTGEGRLDSQSLRGKVVIGIARHTKPKKVPLIAVVGCIEDPIDSVYEEGVTAVFTTSRAIIPFEQVKLRCEDDLRRTMDNLMHLFQA